MRALIVSLHDVAPPFEDRIREQLAMLAAVGIERVVLNVVPNWHGDHPLAAAPALAELLRRRAESGSQIVLHGCEHRPPAPLRGYSLMRLRGELFASDAAEFLALDGDAARAAIGRGVAMLADVGLPSPDTFCPPGWLPAAGSEPFLRRAGMRRLVGMFGLMDLESGRRLRVLGMGHMGTGNFQEIGIRALNSLVGLALPRVSAFKIYLHPQGDPRGVRRMVEVAGRLVASGEWQPVTYGDLPVG